MCTVLNHLNITDYIVEEGQILGAVGFSIEEQIPHTRSEPKRYSVLPVVQQVYTDQTIRDFHVIRCGIRRLTPGAGFAMGIQMRRRDDNL